MITIYTPSFNRASTLPRVFQSLKKQTNFDFEWLIINDGSTDDTDCIVRRFKTDKFSVRYVKKDNGGLNSVMNMASGLANGQYLVRLDSDDYFSENAIETILENIAKIECKSNICSLVFLTQFDNGKINGYHPFAVDTICNFFDYRYKFAAKGDRLEVFKTDVFSKYPFPSFLNELFCPEGVVWNRIAKTYDALYINKAIYIREYNEDSITAAGASTSIKNCNGTTLHYKEILNFRGFSPMKIKPSINYFRYGLCTPISLTNLIKEVATVYSFTGLLLGSLLHLLDCLDSKLVTKVKNFI